MMNCRIFPLTIITLFVLVFGCADLGDSPTDNEIEIVPTLSVDNQIVTEGDSVSFTASLSEAIDVDVAFSFATFDGTAVGNEDYIPVSDSIIISSGLTFVTINIPTVDDTIIESTESFSLLISSPINAIIDTAAGEATIIDNDTVIIIPALSINNQVVTEGDDVTFTVSLNEPAGVDAGFSYVTSDGTAIENEDYSPLSGSKIITAGLTFVTINIPTIDDNIIELTETFNLTISSPINATIDTAIGVAAIIDNDFATVSFSSDIQPLLNNNSCLVQGCHGGISNAGGLTLGSGSYNDIINAQTANGFIIIPYNSQGSSLYLRLTSVYQTITGQRMPQTFIEADTLTTAQQNLVKVWIDEGAIDN